jgi:hypothetical protein
MESNHPKWPDDAQSEDDALDRALDAALAKYAAAEPRAGLEQRILAHLQSESVCLPNRCWWRWCAAGAVVALLAIMLAMPWRSNKPPSTATQRHPSAAIERAQPSATRAAVNREMPATAAGFQRHKATRHHVRQPLVVADAPKLDQFPSPEPLTKEELALVHYVRQFRQDAVIVASAQEELEKEVQHDDAAGRQATSNSIEEER